MNNKLLLAILGTILVGGLIFGIYTVSNSSTATDTSQQSAQDATENTPATSSSPSATSASITTSELAKNTGKNGADCWVAVNGKVYDVTGQKDWVNGSHTPSNGQAQCGQDESAVIGSSPHGSSVLSSLPVVGTLAN
jgi:predicted heme/steroid binding protein